MQLRYTVYNCGTGYNRNSRDIIPQLWRETNSLNMINDGPGSTGNLLARVPGLLAGSGVDANVNRAVEEIKRRNTVTTMVLNMAGWSRGAVTCFKIANALHRDNSTQNITVNIYGIDPVPGGSFLNDHMWEDIDVTPNIGMCSAILAQHDRRSLFSPYYPTVRGPFTDIDIMPGNHSELVEDKGVNREAHQLVKHLTKQFLISRGTVFKNNTLLNDVEILNKYAAIIENFDNYAKGKRKFKDRFKGKRKIKNSESKRHATMLPVKPPFFINGHHREVFQRHFPCLTNAIDTKSIKPGYSIQNNWGYVRNDIENLQNSPLYQSSFDMVTLYFDLVWV